MRARRENWGGGFSLIELVIVVVILSIISAMAIPRMSRGAGGAADSALQGDLSVLRSAIDLYQTEHGGTFPSTDKIESQLCQYSDTFGTTSAAKDPAFPYGPYLRKVPPLPVGQHRGDKGIAASDGNGVGWIYDQPSGDIRANTAAGEVDAAGKLYSTY